MRKIGYWMAMLVCFAGTAAHAALPVVTNVVAQQRADTKLVDINYSVFDDDGDLLRIRVEVSDNAGNTYSVPAFTMTGDIGDTLSPARPSISCGMPGRTGMVNILISCG